MTLHVVAEIWNMVRDNLPDDTVDQVASDMIGILIDNDYDLDDIRHEFTGDSIVQSAIKFYADEGGDDYGDWDDGDLEELARESWDDESDEDY